MSTWLEIQVEVSEPLKEPVINRLFELGAEGVNESDDSVRAYFEEKKRTEVTTQMGTFLDSLAEMHPTLPRPRLLVLSVENQNWADRYKEFYYAQKLTHTFFLRPAWDTTTPIPDGMIPITMDPGQAFGTGLHPSTTLSLKLLEHTLNEESSPGALKLLDVGTGTGILAIGAAKLGVGDITAIDIDPIAVATAEENARVNGCPSIKISSAPLAEMTGPYAIILSNILLETHRALAPEYHRLLRPAGHIVLSGLLAPQRDEIEEIMQRQGFTLEGTESSQEWMAFVFRK